MALPNIKIKIKKSNRIHFYVNIGNFSHFYEKRKAEEPFTILPLFVVMLYYSVFVTCTCHTGPCNAPALYLHIPYKAELFHVVCYHTDIETHILANKD